MLNGIGGKTIEEAKRTITYDEYVDWCLYRKKYGCLNQSVRNDMAVARLMLMVNHALGGKAKYEDMLPNYGGEDRYATVDEIIQMMGARRVERGN